jgi:hypothetical protein
MTERRNRQNTYTGEADRKESHETETKIIQRRRKDRFKGRMKTK